MMFLFVTPNVGLFIYHSNYGSPPVPVDFFTDTYFMSVKLGYGVELTTNELRSNNTYPAPLVWTHSMNLGVL